VLAMKSIQASFAHVQWRTSLDSGVILRLFSPVTLAAHLLGAALLEFHVPPRIRICCVLP